MVIALVISKMYLKWSYKCQAGQLLRRDLRTTKAESLSPVADVLNPGG